MTNRNKYNASMDRELKEKYRDKCGVGLGDVQVLWGSFGDDEEGLRGLCWIK